MDIYKQLLNTNMEKLNWVEKSVKITSVGDPLPTSNAKLQRQVITVPTKTGDTMELSAIFEVGKEVPIKKNQEGQEVKILISQKNGYWNFRMPYRSGQNLDGLKEQLARIEKTVTEIKDIVSTPQPEPDVKTHEIAGEPINSLNPSSPYLTPSKEVNPDDIPF